VPFAGWESAIFSEAGPLVWARGEYEKTGVEPYVHAKGTRIASLRRVARKFPYFTDGSARSLSEVLNQARSQGGHFFHARAPAGSQPLSADEQRALASFLELL
jgi:cytochrome c peroxidase